MPLITVTGSYLAAVVDNLHGVPMRERFDMVAKLISAWTYPEMTTTAELERCYRRQKEVRKGRDSE